MQAQRFTLLQCLYISFTNKMHSIFTTDFQIKFDTVSKNGTLLFAIKFNYV